MDDYVQNMLEVIRLVPQTVSGRRLPDPTPFTVAGWTDVLRFDETSWTKDYWVFRFTAVVKPERPNSPSLDEVIRKVPEGPLEPFTMSPETTEWFRRLAIRQGRTKRQARAIADLATKAERCFARSVNQKSNATDGEWGRRHFSTVVRRRTPGRTNPQGMRLRSSRALRADPKQSALYGGVMGIHSDLQAYANVLIRRKSGTVLNAAELRLRIDEFGDGVLNSRFRRDGFQDLCDALMPDGYSMVIDSSSGIQTTGHQLFLDGRLWRDGQDVAGMTREFHLDAGVVIHKELIIRQTFRRAGLSLRLMDRGLKMYRQLGLRTISVHAALETGRFQWARLGFDFGGDLERILIQTWTLVCCIAVGQAPPTPFSLDSLATLGTAPQDLVSLEELHQAIQDSLGSLTALPGVPAALAVFERRARQESGHRWGWDSEERLRHFANANSIAYDQPLELGKAILLSGPDWFGTFDLSSPEPEEIFDREFELKLRTKR